MAPTESTESVKARCLPPFSHHQLTSIALNSISKWRARDLPSFNDYYKKYKKIPENLTFGFAHLMAMYSLIKKEDGKYYVALPKRKIEIKDDAPYLEYFENGKSIEEFMKKKDVWGVDLTKYKGFYDEVKKTVDKLIVGEN